MKDPTDSIHPTTAHEAAVDPATQPTLFGETPPGGDAPSLAPLPGYELIREIGRGGMGVVYLARQTGFNRLAAVKMVLSGEHSTAGRFSRFRQEAEAVARVQHPNIVQVYEIGEQDGRPWFSMEYVEGGALDGRLAGKPLSVRSAAKLAETLADAVASMHACGVVHRDLKPGNILVRAQTLEGEGGAPSAGASLGGVRGFHSSAPGDDALFPKISDFGLAKSVDGEAGARTADGSVLGSPNYMSPEQAMGWTDRIGPLSDVYSLGAVLYELLTGRPPFRAATVLETVRQVIDDDPIPPSRLQGGVPRDLETICLKCLSKEIGRRYEGAAALRDDLRRYLGGEPILARPGSAFERMVKAARRRPGVAAAAATAVLAVAAVVAIVCIDNRRLAAARGIAEGERDRADEARRTAESERATADLRLDKAIEAIERGLTLAASTEWAKPEFAKARRQMLEDAVAFYESFLAQDSDDPRIRREAAVSLYRAGAAAAMLGDYAHAESLLNRSRKMQEKLAEEAPDEPRHRHDLAQTLWYLGHTALLQNRSSDGAGHYERSTQIMEDLLKLHPDDAAYQATLVEDYSILWNFLIATNQSRADYCCERSAALCKKLLSRVDPPLEHRVLCVGSLLQNANRSFVGGRPAAARAGVDEAKKLLKTLDGATPSTAKTQDMLEQARATAAIVDGTLIARTGRAAEGTAELRKGVARLDAMLRRQPKRFDMRMQMLNALELIARLQQSYSDDASARKAYREFMDFHSALLADEPQLEWLKLRAFVPRSMLMVYDARVGGAASLERDVERLLADSKTGPSQVLLTLRYNAACAFAQASRFGSAEERQARARRALELLRDLKTKSDYFRNPTRATELRKDPDLNPIRSLPPFAELLK